MSDFWSYWIIFFTLLVLFGSCWLLIANRKTEVRGDLAEGEVPKTGHVYDGIEEYDNPLPAWWFWKFIATAVFSLIYLLLYPGLGNYPGLLGWTSTNQLEERVASANAKLDGQYSAYAKRTIDDLAGDPSALRMGRRLFNNNCSICHGVGGTGANGFPNLADADWLYGSTPEAIKHSIAFGRQAAMPAWGSILGEPGVVDMGEHLLSLSGADHNAEQAARGATQYGLFCSSCHTPAGTGMQALGAPNLSDSIWLYQQQDLTLAENIRHSIRSGRNGNMPAHNEKLRPEKIHLLTAYVYSLSQNQQ
ncbi:cytochrome-c oxidase, cbb3-type subunit III [Porticoccaceae bacterium]|nr:cytochrome-c oxidase, cbb3-type subunit III [Porticoccaceae bacterium]